MNLASPIPIVLRLWLLPVFGWIPFNIRAQGVSLEHDITFRSQVRVSVAAIFCDPLKIENEGRRHMRSAPAPSGEFALSYYRHIQNRYGLVLGAGVSVMAYNFRYKFTVPDNSIFVTNNPYQDEGFVVHELRSEYDGVIFILPVSIHKQFDFRGRALTLEVGLRANVPNIDPYYLPYQWSKGHTQMLDWEGNEAVLMSSEIQTTGNFVSWSGFAKVGLIKVMTKKQHTLEYRLIGHWSPAQVRSGTYEFHNLGYVSRGTFRKNMNFIGFECTYGLTTGRRVRGEQVRKAD